MATPLDRGSGPAVMVEPSGGMVSGVLHFAAAAHADGGRRIVVLSAVTMCLPSM